MLVKNQSILNSSVNCQNLRKKIKFEYSPLNRKDEKITIASYLWYLLLAFQQLFGSREFNNRNVKETLIYAPNIV